MASLKFEYVATAISVSPSETTQNTSGSLIHSSSVGGPKSANLKSFRLDWPQRRCQIDLPAQESKGWRHQRQEAESTNAAPVAGGTTQANLRTQPLWWRIKGRSWIYERDRAGARMRLAANEPLMTIQRRPISREISDAALPDWNENETKNERKMAADFRRFVPRQTRGRKRREKVRYDAVRECKHGNLST